MQHKLPHYSAIQSLIQGATFSLPLLMAETSYILTFLMGSVTFRMKEGNMLVPTHKLTEGM